MRIPSSLDRRRLLSLLAGLPLLTVFSRPRRALAGRFADKKPEERMIDNYPEFADKRSRKVIFAAHCIINQNARCNNSGNFPSAIPGVAELLLERRIGIIQMTCPELGCLGLGREGLIYDQLSAHGNRRFLRLLARDVVYQVREYRKHGFRVLGVLGIDCSPSCGVNCHAYNGAKPGMGAYMEELSEQLALAGLDDLPLIGVEDEHPEKAMDRIKELDG